MVALSNRISLTDPRFKAFHTTDAALSNAEILVFYGPSAAHNTPSNTNPHIQCHVFTAAGVQCYQRLLISPSSPLYAAVSCLARSEQGDEACRILAYSLYKYFSELATGVKEAWLKRSFSGGQSSLDLKLFTEMHAANLASHMVQVPHSGQIGSLLERAFRPHRVDLLDIDLELPSGSINDNREVQAKSHDTNVLPDGLSRYGSYASLVQLFGRPAFPNLKKSHESSSPSQPNHTSKDSEGELIEKIKAHLSEIIATEENYVRKLQEVLRLVFSCDHPAAESNFEDDVGAFYTHLKNILLVNSAFLEANYSAEGGFCAPENAAFSKYQGSLAPMEDHQHAIQAVKIWVENLLQSLPDFTSHYGAYLKLYKQSSHTLKSISNGANDFALKARTFGEQRLMSTLIEPIQRLPRYVLFIDNLSATLHADTALCQSLAEAKDKINSICVQHEPRKQFAAAEAFSAHVSRWPTHFIPSGRFIDVTELSEVHPPYSVVPDSVMVSGEVVAILFTNYLVFLTIDQCARQSARHMISETRKFLKSDAGSFSGQGAFFKDLTYLSHISLNRVMASISEDETLIQLTSCHPAHTSLSSLDSRPSDFFADAKLFCLTGASREQNAQWIRRLMRAQVEGRFSRPEDESPLLRVYETTAGPELDYITTVFESREECRPLRGATCRVVVDSCNEDDILTVNEQDAVDIAVSIRTLTSGLYRVDIASRFDRGSTDVMASTDFISAFSRRISRLVWLRNTMRNPILVPILLARHDIILKSLGLNSACRARSSSNVRTLRQQSHSPVKALASIFSATSSKENQEHRPALLSKRDPKLNVPLVHSSSSQVGSETKTERVTSLGSTIDASPSNDIEEIFRTLVTAIRARKGNVVGRSVSERQHAEHSIVQQLLSALSKNPADYERASHEQVDVLFASFDLFLGTSWSSEFGPVLPRKFLRKIHTSPSLPPPASGHSMLHRVMNELSEQNRRAFEAIIDLTNDLLETMTSDGDKGALIAGITEMVVQDSEANEFIPVIDQICTEGQESSSTCDASDPTMWQDENADVESSGVKDTMSIGGKGSSLSKRLGFHSNSGNARTDQTARVGGVFRHWSKNARSREVDKFGLGRTQSVGATSSAKLSRPRSQDGPSTPNRSVLRNIPIIESDGNIRGQVSFLNRHLNGASKSTYANVKRRSSLSELECLPLPNMSPLWSTTTSQAALSPCYKANAGPLTDETPSLQNASPTSLRTDILVSDENRLTEASSSDSMRHSAAASLGEPYFMEHDEPPSWAHAFSKVLASTFEEPVDQNSRGVLTQSLSSGNARSRKPSFSLSEHFVYPETRHDCDSKIVARFGEILYSNTTTVTRKCFDELRDLLLKSRQPDANSLSPLEPLLICIANLQSKMELQLKDLCTEDSDSLEQILAMLSGKKVKRLEKQLDLQAAEIDALYRRSNQELQKTFNSVQRGEGVEELKRNLRSGHAEMQRLRKENEQLRKERRVPR